MLGLPNARFFKDDLKGMAAEQQRALLREARHAGVAPGGELPPAYLLSLSGGGDNGAFGAGLLVGWTAHGDRPKFKLVTGVSTGSLIAPFAFLGSEYDAALTDVYTNIDPGKVFEKRFLPVAALAQNGLSDTHPLYDLISHYVDEPLLARIAAEYEKGRLLLIQTTDLDAGRPVVWNIGAIAASGRPEAIDLVRHILLASASIPAAFPPVMFDVEVEGQSYQEMHVDGGAVSQAFLVPTGLDPNDRPREGRVSPQKRRSLPDPQRPADHGMERRRSAHAVHRREGRLDDDQLQRRQRPLSHVSRDAARQRRLQRRLYRRGLPRAASLRVRPVLHAGALSLRLR